MKRYYAGVDLGGTHMAAGIVNAAGRLLSRAERPTRAGRPAGEILRDIAECAAAAAEQAGIAMKDIAALGIGVPGFADEESGTVSGCNNLGWDELPLRREMAALTPLPVHVANDADCAALAESRIGAAAGAESCVLITLGTGVGGGIILNGKIWRGAHQTSGEIGHMVLYPGGLPCNCGRRGCVERYCSATALRESVIRNASAFPDSAVFRDAERPDAKVIVDAAKAGDPLACFVFDTFVQALATTIDSMLFLLDPEAVLLGGGVSRAGDFLLRAVREKLPRIAMGVERKLPRLGVAALGNEAGILGAAMLGMPEEGNHLSTEA